MRTMTAAWSAMTWRRAITALMIAATAAGGLVSAVGLIGTAPVGASVTAGAPAAGRVPVPSMARLPALASGRAAKAHVLRVLPLSAGKPVAAWSPHTSPLVRSVGLHQRLRDDVVGSENWSGYVDSGQGADFTGVAASWTVPTVQAGTEGDSSSWVGIDGTSTSDLVQAGTDQSWSPSGGAVYYAWYELLPAVSTELGAVAPGDHISVSIVEAQPGSWTITVDDSTQGTMWTEPVSYNAPGDSAEWVEEAPTLASDNTIEALADFGTVQFANLGVAGPGTASATAYPVYMVNKSDQVIAYPDQYSSATDSFTDTYGSTSLSGSVPDAPIGPASGTSTSSTSSTTTSTSSTTAASTAGAPPGSTPSPAPQGQVAAQNGYWLVGRDGGIFAFGTAGFHGSTGKLALQRQITGIAPTADDGGYWLVASDGGVFAFGDANYEGSLPADGIAPVGPGAGRHLAAPIVGIVPTPDGKGYLMVAKDGGVFAFGDAHFEGSCATIGGCDAAAVAVVPDATDGGYWLLLSNCDMVPFGNAPNIADGNCESSAAANELVATSAAR